MLQYTNVGKIYEVDIRDPALAITTSGSGASTEIRNCLLYYKHLQFVELESQTCRQEHAFEIVTVGIWSTKIVGTSDLADPGLHTGKVKMPAFLTIFKTG